jgi:hypothetical protein
MLWNQVVILKSDIADASITALRDKYDAALRAEIEATGIQENALVAYGKDSAGNHVFYFSPAAVSIASAAGILSEFGGIDLPNEPNLNGFTKF